MPFKLIAPKPGRTPYFRVRGTYLGVYLDRSTETADRRTAAKLLAGWRAQVERGEITGRQELTFDAAVVSYIQAGGDGRFLERVVGLVGTKRLAREISQGYVDEIAASLYPDASPATRNRQVYTPVLAVLRHAKIPAAISRPKGSAGEQRHIWLEQADFQKVHDEARKIDPELALLLLVVFYTGLRLSEALSIRIEDIKLDQETAFVGHTKNGRPRAVYLPPVLIAALAGREGSGLLFDRLSRLRDRGGSRFYAPVYRAYANAGIDPQGAPFHIGRHSFGRAMTRAGADLVATNVWRSRAAAAVYQHYDHNEEARKALLIPGAKGK